jgi:hypothetical protein
VLDLPLGYIEQQPLDDVPHVLHVDRELDDLGPAPRLARLQGFAADLREVALDGRIQAIDLVVLAPQRLGELCVVVSAGRSSRPESISCTVSASRMASRAELPSASAGVSMRDRIQVPRLAEHLHLAPRGQPLFRELRDAPGQPE